MKYLVVLCALWATLRPASAAVTCAPQLGPRDLTLEALAAVHQLPDFKKIVWEFALNSNAGTPFVIVVGPDSWRKTNAIKQLAAAVPKTRVYDVPSRTSAGFAAGRDEFRRAAWLTDVHLHVLDVGIARDFQPLDWRDVSAASAALLTMGFSDLEVMSTTGVYLIEP